MLNDLLDPSRANLKLREDPKRGFYVEGIKEETLVSAEHALSVIATGVAHRKVEFCPHYHCNVCFSQHGFQVPFCLSFQSVSGPPTFKAVLIICPAFAAFAPAASCLQPACVGHELSLVTGVSYHLQRRQLPQPHPASTVNREQCPA